MAYRSLENLFMLTRDRRPVVLAAAGVLALLNWQPPSAAYAGALTIDQCGQRIAAGQTGYLAADLDCRDSVGVVLENRATLVMGGHYLRGAGWAADELWQGVRCITGSKCSVVGPGSIGWFSASGIAGTRVYVREVAIEGNARSGVAAYENVSLRDVSIEANGETGVFAGGRIRVRRSSVERHPIGRLLSIGHPRFRPERAAKRH